MIETGNKFMIAMRGDRLWIMALNRLHLMSPDDALLLAAYLVAMAQPFATERFDAVLEAVQNA